MNIVQHFYQHIPILGVGLGHKIIAASFDGIFRRAKTVKHGKTSTIQHNGEGIFANLPPTFEVMRYDSLVVDGNQLPTALKVTATTVDTNEVMGLQHENYPVFGIQFHPESIGTENGRSLIQNFIKEVKGERVQ